MNPTSLPDFPGRSRAGVVACAVPGDVTSTTEADVRTRVEAAIRSAAPGWSTLELDLRAARIVDSKGLNFLVTLLKSQKAAGRRMRFLAPQPAVRRILTFTQIDRHAEVVAA